MVTQLGAALALPQGPYEPATAVGAQPWVRQCGADPGVPVAWLPGSVGKGKGWALLARLLEVQWPEVLPTFTSPGVAPRPKPQSLTGAEAGGAPSGSAVLTGVLQAAPGERPGEAEHRWEQQL